MAKELESRELQRSRGTTEQLACPWKVWEWKMGSPVETGEWLQCLQPASYQNHCCTSEVGGQSSLSTLSIPLPGITTVW